VSEWIANNEDLSRWLDANASVVLGMDTEFMRTETFFAKLALLQVNIGGAIGLIDTPAIDSPLALSQRLGDPNVLCVMHSASEDLEALMGILPNGPGALFDTQIAAGMVGLGYGLSYQKLVALLLQIDIPKAETRSDWLKRPLSDSQLEYAAQDVAYLPDLRTQLEEKLAALGRSEWLAEDCARLIARVCRTPPDNQPQRAFRNAYDWSREEQIRLRRLLLWRESAARRLDKPRPWLLDDARVMNLAAEPPADDDTLFERTKGLRALRSPQRQELLELLHAPPGSDDNDLAPIPPPLDSPQKRALTAMKNEVAAIAEKLGIPDGLLCARRHLETLVTEHVWPSALEGWRRPLLHDVLMSKLP
jgi:ribonuclease D